jgi:hypothetical protein
MEHDHPDFDHLSEAVGKASQLVQKRQDEAVFLENQIKLAQVQERFSQNLYLNLPLDCVDVCFSFWPPYGSLLHGLMGFIIVRLMVGRKRAAFLATDTRATIAIAL